MNGIQNSLFFHPWMTSLCSPLSSFFKTIFFPFVKQISFRRTNIRHARTSVAILLHLYALLAVVCIWLTLSSTYNTFSLERTVVTVVANCDDNFWTDERVTNDTLAIAVLTHSCNSVAHHFPAECQVSVVCCHGWIGGGFACFFLYSFLALWWLFRCSWQTIPKLVQCCALLWFLLV